MPTLITKKFDSAGTVGTNGCDFNTYAALNAYVNGTALVTDDQTVEIIIAGTLTFPSAGNLKPPQADDTHKVRLRPVDSSGVNDLERTTFSAGTSGGAIAINRDNTYETTFGPGMEFYGLRWLITGTSAGSRPAFISDGKKAAMTVDVVYRNNRFYDTSASSSYLGGFTRTNANARVLFTDNLVVIDGGANKVAVSDYSTGQFLRNTFIAINAAKGTTKVFEDLYGGQIIRSNIANGFTYFYSSTIPEANKTNNFVNVAPTSGSTVGWTVVAGTNALVVNEATDYRPKAGSSAIGGAHASSVSTTDILGNNRGTSPDPGAWQLTPASPLPSGTITTKTISGSTVTLSGTTTNSPASSLASLTPTSTPYNSAVAQTNAVVTLGTGTFTVTFNSVKDGEYLPEVTFSKTGVGTAAATNGVGNVALVSATGSVSAQAISGPTLTVSGTTTGSPTSGVMYIPAGATPDGAFSLGPIALTLGAGTFTVSTDVTPGNYDKPVVVLTTARGTSLPLTGAPLAAFSVIGISGNPEAPQVAPVTSTVTGVSVSPSTATGSTTFTATATGTNPPQTFTWATTGGQVDSAGNFTEPAKTTSAQTITVTATSTADTSKSGTATVTIAALAPPAPVIRTVTVRLFRNGQPAANLTGLDWSWHDQPRISLMGAPTDQGAGASTNAQGYFTMSLPNSKLAVNGVGRISVFDPVIDPDVPVRGFSAPAKVA